MIQPKVFSTSVKFEENLTSIQQSNLSVLPMELIKKILQEIKNNIDQRGVLLTNRAFLALGLELYESKIYSLGKLLNAIKKKEINLSTLRHIMEKVDSCDFNYALGYAVENGEVEALNEMLEDPKSNSNVNYHLLHQAYRFSGWGKEKKYLIINILLNDPRVDLSKDNNSLLDMAIDSQDKRLINLIENAMKISALSKQK